MKKSSGTEQKNPNWHFQHNLLYIHRIAEFSCLKIYQVELFIDFLMTFYFESSKLWI